MPDLTPTLQNVLLFYSLVIGTQISAICLIIGHWRLLPQGYRSLCLPSVFCALIGFVICTYYLMNTVADCTTPRKVAYAFFYLGFFLFDTYQYHKVCQITRATFWQRIGLGFVVFLHVVAMIINLVVIGGTTTGYGSCTTVLAEPYLVQERVMSVFLELCIVLQFGLYIRGLVLSEQDNTKKIYKKMLDIEVIGFLLCFLGDVAYETVYFIHPPGVSVSLLNTFAIDLPVIIIFLNGVFLVGMNVKIQAASLSSGSMSNRSQQASTPGEPQAIDALKRIVNEKGSSALGARENVALKSRTPIKSAIMANEVPQVWSTTGVAKEHNYIQITLYFSNADGILERRSCFIEKFNHAIEMNAFIEKWRTLSNHADAKSWDLYDQNLNKMTQPSQVLDLGQYILLSPASAQNVSFSTLPTGFGSPI